MLVTDYLKEMRWESIKNTSEGTCPAFGLFAIVGSEQVGRRTILHGEKPSTTFYRDYAVNGPTAIPAGKYGRCTRMSGGLWIKYDSGTPLNGEGWGPKPGQWEAAKGFPGITVEGIKSSSRTLLLGTLGEVRTLLCKATASLSAGPVSADFVIWSGRRSSGADAGFTTLPTIELAADVPDDDFFLAHWANGGWETSAGGGGGGGTRLGIGSLAEVLGSGTPTVSVDNVTMSDGEAISLLSATNPMSLAGPEDASVIIAEITFGFGNPFYYIVNVKHYDCATL